MSKEIEPGDIVYVPLRVKKFGIDRVYFVDGSYVMQQEITREGDKYIMYGLSEPKPE